MAKKHKHATKRYWRYNRESVINWCLDWSEYLHNLGCEHDAKIAFAWACWCEIASQRKLNQQCREWEAFDKSRESES